MQTLSRKLNAYQNTVCKRRPLCSALTFNALTLSNDINHINEMIFCTFLYIKSDHCWAVCHFHKYSSSTVAGHTLLGYKNPWTIGLFPLGPAQSDIQNIVDKCVLLWRAVGESGRKFQLRQAFMWGLCSFVIPAHIGTLCIVIRRQSTKY